MGRPMPYQPMGQRREVSQERMAAILAKRSGGRVEVAPKVSEVPFDERPSPPQTAETLVWTRMHATMMQSGCTRYQIYKEVVGNHRTHDGGNTSTGRWVYQPWKRVEWLWYHRLGPICESFDAAKAACEKDAKA